MTELTPLEWLCQLQREPQRYWALLDACQGELAIAAHRVAVAKLLTHRTAVTPIPSKVELYVAAREVARGLGGDFRCPGPQALKSIAEAAHLPVL